MICACLSSENPDSSAESLANELLNKLGYTEPASTNVFDDNMARRLRRFQKVNGLIDINGKLDNPTLNRLFHLDFANKTLERAKPYDADVLKGFDDTKNATGDTKKK